MPIMQNKCSPITHPKLLNPKFSMNIGTEKNNTDNVNMLDKFSKLYLVLKWIIQSSIQCFHTVRHPNI